MVESLLGGGSLETDVLDRVVTAAEGNPLFAEQLLRMLVDEGVLQRDERRLARRTAVRPPRPTDDPGASRGAPRHPRRGRALGDRAGVGGRLRVRRGRGRRAGSARGIAAGRTELTTLAQKHLVQRVDDGDESHHRFQHIMIRDTAYDGILKRARADLHERFVAGPTR